MSERNYDLNKIIIPTPYSDRGCYNCFYHILKREERVADNYCELHKCPICIWKWCEGWNKEK